MNNLNINGANKNIFNGSISNFAAGSKCNDSLPTANEIRKYVEENLDQLVNVRAYWHAFTGYSDDTALVWNRVINKLEILKGDKFNTEVHVNMAFLEVNVSSEDIPENDYKKIVHDAKLCEKYIAYLSKKAIRESKVDVQHELSGSRIDTEWEFNVREELGDAMDRINSNT